MGIVLLTSIILTTIVYSAFNAELQIEGDAIFRIPEEVRITGLKLLNFSDGAIESYNNKYGKDTTSMYVSIPSKGSMTYEVEVTNNLSTVYEVTKINKITNSNSNISIEVELDIYDLIEKKSKKTFTIKLANNATTQQVGTIVYQFLFSELPIFSESYSSPKTYTVSIPYKGEYVIELWGAGVCSSGGAYTKGNISLDKSDILYVYVGEKPIKTNFTSFNGGTGSQGGMPGGGATDIRLVNGNWDSFNSLKSRIMVAAGSGDTCGCSFGTGYGGTLKSFSNTSVTTEATQTSGGIVNDTVCGSSGKFGVGGACAGGGGGYYGGAGAAYSEGGGTGGSSFISGHAGCNAITSSSIETKIVHTGKPEHYSGKVFTNTQMIAGNESMPTYDGLSTMAGNINNGYAKITLVKRSL